MLLLSHYSSHLWQLFSEVIDMILSSMGRDELVGRIRDRLLQLREELDEDSVDITKFEILKVR